jgi:hypothetical protein
MDSAELERLLRLWGRWFGVPPQREWDEDSSHGVGVLTQKLIEQTRVGAGYTERTKRLPLSARAVNYLRAGLDVPPTARGRQSDGGATPWLPDVDADRVELAALDLYRYNLIQGIVLRCEYCLRGPRYEVKLPAAREYLADERLKLRRYRQELDLARAWMFGRLSGIFRSA